MIWQASFKTADEIMESQLRFMELCWLRKRGSRNKKGGMNNEIEQRRDEWKWKWREAEIEGA